MIVELQRIEMKKITCCIILTLLVFSICACSLNTEKNYHIKLDDSDNLICSCPKSAKAGEMVVINTVFLCDGDIILSISGVKNINKNSDTEYTFEMPECEVVVSAKITTEGYSS